MQLWLLLAIVGGLLTGLLLTMIIGFHLLDTNATKQCLHKSQQQKEDSGSGVIEPGQLCCLCGNVRNRRTQAQKASSKGEAIKSNGILQPLVDACGKLPANSLRIRCLGSRTSRRTGIANGLQGTWFNAASFFRGAGKAVAPVAKGGDTQSNSSVASVINRETLSSESMSSAAVSNSSSGSTTTITTTITTTTTSASAPTLCGECDLIIITYI
jgi:hypothetical protein